MISQTHGYEMTVNTTQIEEFGSGALITLKEILGHELLETTAKYLKGIARGILSWHLSKLWNDSIDGDVDEE